MKDTSPEVERRFNDLLRRLSPAERLAMCCRMFTTAKSLARAGIVQAGAQTAAATRKQLFLRFYGRDFTEPERARIISGLRVT